MTLSFDGSVAVPRLTRIRRQNVPVTSVIAVVGLEHVAIAGDSLWVDGLGNHVADRSKVVKRGSRAGGLAGFTEFGGCNFVDQLAESLESAETLRDVIFDFKERIGDYAQLALQRLRSITPSGIETFSIGILIAECDKNGVSGFSASMTVDGKHCDVEQERWIPNTERSTCYIVGVGDSVEYYAEPLRTLLEERALLAVVGDCTIPILATSSEQESAARSLVQRVIDNETAITRPAWWKSGVPLVLEPISVVSL